LEVLLDPIEPGQGIVDGCRVPIEDLLLDRRETPFFFVFG
jgi:hypothetical protein